MAGDYNGLFREDMFDEGQGLPSAYHRTKFESEKIARESLKVPVARLPARRSSSGTRSTGQMDKIDGPYYFFKAIQKAARGAARVVPARRPRAGATRTSCRSTTSPTRWTTSPTSPTSTARPSTWPTRACSASGEVLNTFARAAHAPQLALRVDKRLTDALPKGVFSMLMKLPALKDVRKTLLADVGIPDEVIEHVGFRAQFDTRDTERALAGSGIEVPELDEYAWRLWDYWERHLDPDLFRDRSFEGAINGRTVVITGASSGHRARRRAQDRRRRRHPDPRGARRWTSSRPPRPRSRRPAARPTSTPPTSPTSTRSTRSSSGCWPTTRRSTCSSTTPGRSIRRSVSLSLDRFHDYERTMQLNYFGAIKLVMGLLPHLKERGSGHVVNVSSIGAQTNPPRFSAYVASKAALDAWTRVVSSEVVGDGITFTTIHMPLVRTPMIAPTKIYDSFPTITPDEAGDLVCEAIRSKPKQINTAPGHLRRGGLLARAEGRRPDPAHGLPRLPGLGGGQGPEGPQREGLDGAGRDGQPHEGRPLVARAAATTADGAVSPATRMRGRA